MELTDQQRQGVKEWLAAGASLSDVQKNLKNEFGIAVTYMDVRLMVLEIGAEVKDKPEPKPVEPQPALQPEPPPQQQPEDDPYADEAFDDGAADSALPADNGTGGPATNVSVSLDRVVRPGAMVSGDVTFSDGSKGKWLIDQYGRFGLDPDTPGYRPSQADLQIFQMKLREELRRHGYG